MSFSTPKHSDFGYAISDGYSNLSFKFGSSIVNLSNRGASSNISYLNVWGGHQLGSCNLRPGITKEEIIAAIPESVTVTDNML